MPSARPKSVSLFRRTVSSYLPRELDPDELSLSPHRSPHESAMHGIHVSPRTSTKPKPTYKRASRSYNERDPFALDIGVIDPGTLQEVMLKKLRRCRSEECVFSWEMASRRWDTEYSGLSEQTENSNSMNIPRTASSVSDFTMTGDLSDLSLGDDFDLDAALWDDAPTVQLAPIRWSVPDPQSQSLPLPLSGPISKLVELLAPSPDQKIEKAYVRCFLVTHRCFMRSTELLEMLLQRYYMLVSLSSREGSNSSPDLSLSLSSGTQANRNSGRSSPLAMNGGVKQSAKAAKIQSLIQLRITSVIRLWMESCYQDWVQDGKNTMIQIVTDYVARIRPFGGKGAEWVENLLKTFERATLAYQAEQESEERTSGLSAGESASEKSVKAGQGARERTSDGEKKSSDVGHRRQSLGSTRSLGSVERRRPLLAKSFGYSHSTGNLTVPHPLLPRNIGTRPLTVLDVHPLELARQLTLIEFSFFAKIAPHELQKNAWLKHPERSPHVVTLTEHFNKTSFWIASEIIQTPDASQRVVLISRFIQLAQYMRELGNFNGLMEVIGALNMNAVSRLKITWAEVPEKQVEVFQGYTKDMDSLGGYKVYRELLKEAPSPKLPFQGVYLGDFTKLDENPDFVQVPIDEKGKGKQNLRAKGASGSAISQVQVLNMEKFLLMGEMFAEIEEMQKVPYCFDRVQAVVDMFEKAPRLSQFELWVGSKNCESSVESTAVKIDKEQVRSLLQKLEKSDAAIATETLEATVSAANSPSMGFRGDLSAHLMDRGDRKSSSSSSSPGSKKEGKRGSKRGMAKRESKRETSSSRGSRKSSSSKSRRDSSSSVPQSRVTRDTSRSGGRESESHSLSRGPAPVSPVSPLGLSYVMEEAPRTAPMPRRSPGPLLEGKLKKKSPRRSSGDVSMRFTPEMRRKQESKRQKALEKERRRLEKERMREEKERKKMLLKSKGSPLAFPPSAHLEARPRSNSLI